MKFHHSKSILYVAALALLLAACGDKKDGESDTEDTEDPAGTVNGTGGGGTKTDTFSVVGTWVRTNCAAAALALGEGEGGDGPEYKKQSFAFTADGAMTVGFTMFAEEACATKTMEMNVDATYTLGAELSADPQTEELDAEVVTGTITVHSQDFVDDLNGEGDGGMSLLGDGFCTKETPWVAGEAVSFADLECPSDFPKIGGKIYDVISVVGDVMRMSVDEQEDGKDTTTPETRGTTLSTADDEAFTKEAEAK